MNGVEQAKQFDTRNLLAAMTILEDPERYDGLPLIWARAVLQRLGYLPLTEGKDIAA